jgi:vancomycin resistance protein VanW
MGRETDMGVVARGWRAASRRAHEVARRCRWMVEPRAFPAPLVAAGWDEFPHRLFEASVPLCGAGALGEPALEEGKRVNVALAAPALDGVVLSPRRPLSFWRAVGRPSRARGFQAGVEIRGGCLIPSIGGGLCLVSNTLFAMAARLGWTIIERHGHSADVSRALPGDPPGLDATVLWPYIDLRVAPRVGSARLSARVRGGAFELAVDADRPAPFEVALAVEDGGVDGAAAPAGEPWRERRVVRTLRERGGGRLVAREVIAHDRKRVVAAAARTRTCLSCGEASCATGLVALRRTR